MNTDVTYDGLNFDEIVRRLQLFLSSSDEFNDYNYNASGIRMLIDLLAYNARQSAFYQNMSYNELTLNAELDDNMAGVAALLSHTPKSKTASSGVYTFVVTPPTNIATPLPEITMNRNFRCASVKDDVVYNLSPDQEYTALLINGVYTFENVKMLQGTWIDNSYVVSGEAIETYTIPNNNIDTSTLEVQVQLSETNTTRNTHIEFNDAFQLGRNEPIYFLEKGKQGLYTLEFGDDQIARKLNNGNIVVIRYLTTDGEDGNELSKVVPVGTINGYNNITINETTKTTGGSNEESIEVTRKLAPKTFKSQGQAVVDDDYITLVKSLYSQDVDVTAWGGEVNDPPRDGYSFIAVALPTGNLTQNEKDQIFDLLKLRNVGSITPIIVDADYYYLNIDTKIKYDPSLTTLNSQALTTVINSAIINYGLQNLSLFGTDFVLSELSEYISDVDTSILSNVTAVSYEKRFVPELNAEGYYVIRFSKKIKDVYVDNFTVSGLDPNASVFIEDDGEGTLKLKKTLNGVTSVISDIGSVDYENGIVNISQFRPNTINEYTRVSCKSNDTVFNDTGFDYDLVADRDDIFRFTDDINIVLEANKR